MFPSFAANDQISKLDSIIVDYDTYVSAFLAENQIPGAAIAIVSEGEIIFLKGYGIQKVGEDRPVDANTVFRIASVSKGFASVLTGLLVRDGILKWDDKVIDYLPDFALIDSAHTNNLTIRHLLSHTSGVVPHAYDNLVEESVPIDTVVKNLRHAPVICDVGSCYSYQNVVYSLIGNVMESATGKTYANLIEERITRPLGMENTSMTKSDLLRTGNYGHPHVRGNGKWYPANLSGTYYDVQPAAGINSSIYDMAVWLKALIDGISYDVMDEICKPEVKTPYERRRFNWQRRIRRAHYGLGWRIFDYAGYRMIFHSGSLRGYLAKLAWLPEYKVGIVILQNAWIRNVFAYKFFDMYLNIGED